MPEESHVMMNDACRIARFDDTTPSSDNALPRRRSKSENAYFLLDLRLPASPRHGSALRRDRGSHGIKHTRSAPSSSSSSPRKFGFLQLLEQVHDKDLTSDNPWLNPLVKHPSSERYRNWREVRFTNTEMMSPELPHCRKGVGGMMVKPGQIHATSCPNSSQETVDALGEHVWVNREFILENTQPRDKSRDWYNLELCCQESCDHRDTSNIGDETREQYDASHNASMTLKACDSLELTKRRLHNTQRSDKNDQPSNSQSSDPQEKTSYDQQNDQSSPEICLQKKPQPPGTPHPKHHPNLLLQLTSAGLSDTDSITPVSHASADDDSVFSYSPRGAAQNNTCSAFQIDTCSASPSRASESGVGSDEQKKQETKSEISRPSFEFDMIPTTPIKEQIFEYTENR